MSWFDNYDDVLTNVTDDGERKLKVLLKENKFVAPNKTLQE
jgi:hypothetical protein